MDAISIDVAIQAWCVFWMTYIIFGSLLSWRAHVTGVRKVVDKMEVFSVVFTNMLWSLPGILLLYLCPLRAWTNAHIIIKLILTYIITDVWFYHVHIMIHHPQLYKKIHKLHHHDKMMKPYALTALYCTPFEAIFLNIFSVSWGAVIFQIQAPYIYIWYFLVALNSVATHSGLYVPYLIDGSHDLHHKLFNYNYGVSPYLDWIYGTLSPAEQIEKEVQNIVEKKDLANFPINTAELENINS